MSKDVKKQVAEVISELSQSIKTGKFGKRPTIGLTLSGSEHGKENILEGARLAQADGTFDVVIVGTTEDKSFKSYPASGQEEEHDLMDKLLDQGEIDACITNHYNFPIGVSTVGMVKTPAKGKNMILATTTGTSATARVEAMVRNAVAGIICAKSIGISKPKLGILNLEGARGTEKALKDLQAKGYDIKFTESLRADGGVVMRGNDLLMGVPDVMVCDSLSGNILMKVFSSYVTGGSYEGFGYGYGPGIGKDYKRKIFIISRASGAEVIANAMRFAAMAISNNIHEIQSKEYSKAEKCGFNEIIASLNKDKAPASTEEIKQPEKEIVTAALSGIDIMELDDAVMSLWKEGIYAESGMGCTGPVVLVSPAKHLQAKEILIKSGYMAEDKKDC